VKDGRRVPRSGAIRVGFFLHIIWRTAFVSRARGRGSDRRRPASAAVQSGPARTADRRRHDPWFLQLPKEPIMSDRPARCCNSSGPALGTLDVGAIRPQPSSFATSRSPGSSFATWTSEHVRLDEVEPAHVSMYLACKLRRYRQRHGRAAASMTRWRSSHTAGIHQLLRVVRGSWPVAPAARSPSELYFDGLLAEFAQWLHAQRGLAARFHRRHGRRSATTSLVVQGQRRHDRSQGHAAR
jgi:hypothetical protein